jgi:hypothetical protein
LLPTFGSAYVTALAGRATQRSTLRQRQPGAGRPATLATPEDKLLFILFYFKFYPTQALLGFMFGISQPQANMWIHLLTPVLNAALGRQKQLPARKATALMQVLEACPGLEFIIDGTERPIQRPHDTERQKQFGSCRLRGEGDHHGAYEVRRHPFEIMCPHKYGTVLIQEALTYAAERAQEVSYTRPDTFDRVGMDFTDTIAVIIPRLCALSWRMADGLMAAACLG